MWDERICTILVSIEPAGICSQFDICENVGENEIHDA